MMSVVNEQQLAAESLVENDEEESLNECNECARWSSLDSVDPALGEEQISYNLPPSDAAPPDVTFAVEVDSQSLDSYHVPTGLLDPKTVLTIMYGLDNPAGTGRCNVSHVCNETFELDGSEDISVPGAHCFTSNSGQALSPVTFRPGSLYTNPSSLSESEYHKGQTSDKKRATVTEKGGKCRSHFHIADELVNSPSFELEGDGNMHTSTPLKSPAANSLDTELTVKPARRNAESGHPEYVRTSARRMLQMYEAINTPKEDITGNCINEKFRNFDVNVHNSSFAVLPSEEDSDKILTGTGCKFNRTYIVSELASSSMRGYSGNLSHCGYITSVRQRDSADHDRRALSLAERSLRRDTDVLQQSADEQSHVRMIDDSSLSIIDVFNDDNAASFFVTDWPSAPTSDHHDLLLSSFYGQSLSSAQMQDVNSPCNVRIVVKSASSQSDFITNWSFSSLMGKDLPSFDGNSVNELALRQQLSLCRFSNGTRLSELGEETQHLNCAGKKHILCCH